MFRSSPVRVRVLFLAVRVMPSGAGSGSELLSGPGFHLQSGFHSFFGPGLSGPGFPAIFVA